MVDSRVGWFLPRGTCVVSFAGSSPVYFHSLTASNWKQVWQMTSFPWAGPKTFRWLWVFDKRSLVIGFVLWSSETPRPSTPAFRSPPSTPIVLQFRSLLIGDGGGWVDRLRGADSRSEWLIWFNYKPKQIRGIDFITIPSVFVPPFAIHRFFSLYEKREGFEGDGGIDFRKYHPDGFRDY